MKSKESVGSYVVEIEETKRELTITHVLELKEKENNLFNLHVCHLSVSAESFKRGILVFTLSIFMFPFPFLPKTG